MKRRSISLEMIKRCLCMNGCRDQRGGRFPNLRRTLLTLKVIMTTTSGMTNTWPTAMQTKMRNGPLVCTNASQPLTLGSLKPTRWRVKARPTFAFTSLEAAAQKDPAAGTTTECLATWTSWPWATTCATSSGEQDTRPIRKHLKVSGRLTKSVIPCASRVSTFARMRTSMVWPRRTLLDYCTSISVYSAQFKTFILIRASSQHTLNSSTEISLSSPEKPCTIKPLSTE